jgi:nucleotide-binding universal stress UspA family protein
MNALPNLTINATDPANPDVDAPGNPGVRDYMLRYLGQMFVGGAFGHTAGIVAGIIVSVVFGLLLLSAVNTAIVDLIAISFLMSRDGELPPRFQRLNQFGVPNLGLIVATVIPMILVLVVKDMSGLADLYAVGVVGAIATNLGACSTDRKLGLVTWERAIMFVTFLIMLAIEVSLFYYKGSARIFAMAVLLVGLILRGLASEYASRYKAAKEAAASATPAAALPIPAAAMNFDSAGADGPPMMCAVRGLGKTLDFAIEESRQTHRPLYLLFVRSLPALTEQDYKKKWQDDEEARALFLSAKSKAGGHPVFPCYAVSDSVADTIVDITATMGASYLILGAPERQGLASLLRGNIIRNITDNLPDDIHLLVYA